MPLNGPRGSTKYFLAGGAAMCLLAAVVVALVPVPMPGWPTRAGLVLAWLAACMLLLAISMRGPGAGSAPIVTGAALLGMALLFALALATGQGLRTISLGYVALLICLVALLAGLRSAALLSLLGLAGVLGLAWAEAQGVTDTAGAIARAPLADAVLAQTLLLAGGLAAGVLTMHASARSRRAAEARERQYAELLAAAADRFWQLDADLRLSDVAHILQPTRQALAQGQEPAHIGLHPWELSDVEIDAAQREAHIADLRAHRPFDDLRTRHVDDDGHTRHMCVSGRPRFGPDGRFRGYWAVGRDVTALVEHQAALERARDDAKAASRAKSAFLANMSHEIRTPLNGLVGLAELARDPATAEPARREYLQRIGECANALTAIIGDVLDLSKIEAGKLQIETVDFDLHALLASLEAVHDMLARARGLAFHVEVQAEVPQHVRGDPVHLRQILANYLGNALKFTPHGSVRLVAMAGPDHHIRFEVHDTGIGIAAADLARVFEPFTQVDNTQSRRFEGTGLGLSICRELAERLGGRVGVSSAAGGGSCFWVELPLAPGQAPAPAATGLTEHGLAGTRVLLVEDNPVNQLIGRALLERWHLQVDLAADGHEALAAADHAASEGRLYDLVLMDLQMPGMSGYEATAELRRRWDAHALPIIALTAAALASERATALAAGMNDLVTKPIDSQGLRSAMARALAGRRRTPP
jgi:signal transduction histidine kinase/ActR/RegA family two-component response regulator